LEHQPKAETPYYLAPGRRLFQIVINVRGERGALGSIIGLLESTFKLEGTTSYAPHDSTSILSVVAEGQSDAETPDGVRSSILTNRAALDAEVLEGREGILVDRFHTGLTTGAGYVMMIRRQSLTKMLDRINRLLGSGGEVVLYEEGIAVGRANGEAFLKSLGAGMLRRNIDYLRSNLTAQGWGEVSVEVDPDGETRRMVVHDCFECSSNEGGRTGCHFFRGYILGNTSATFGMAFTVEESNCKLRGGNECTFVAKPSGRIGSRGIASA
jgi:predicted hydrocarbon binding protein